MVNQESLKGKRIAIIGGAGFIGHNMALKFKKMGAEVSIIDGLEVNNITSVLANTDNLPNPKLSYTILNDRLRLLTEADIPLYVQDARDYHGLCHCLDKCRPNVIVHLAAVSHANRSNKDPFSTFDHSLRTLENALDNSKNKIEHFIYFSSSMVYGNFKEGAVTENSICEPLGIYGALKFAGEKMVIAYNQVFDLPYTIIRPSALYGQRCISRRVGQIFIENALFGKPVTIEGDGSDSLDFTYIEDLIDGISKVISNKNSINQIFNMTFGAARSIKNMLDILQDYFPAIEVIQKERDKLTPMRGTLSIDKAKDLIGYVPNWPLEKGYRKYIEWYINMFESSVAIVLNKKKPTEIVVLAEDKNQQESSKNLEAIAAKDNTQFAVEGK